MNARLVIRVDRSICAGHALCALRAPDVYRTDEEGFCASDGDGVAPGAEDAARLGARACPEGAIRLETAESAGE
jgi:ferredoxin